MTGLQIKELVDATIGETIDNTAALNGINKGILEMGPIVEDEVLSTSYLSNIWYSLPADCSQILEVNIDDESNTIYSNYRKKGGKILFADSDTYIIHYLRKPNILTAITETPEMHTDYHGSLTIYLEGWFKLKEAIDDDEKLEGKTLMDNDFPKKWRQVKHDLRGRSSSQVVAQRYV